MRVPLAAIACVSACGFSSTASSGGGDPSSDATTTDAPRVDAAIDASVDAPPDAPPMWVMVETIDVPCNGTTRTSTTVLAVGTQYRLRASGTCVANTGNGSLADAEYFGWNVGPNYDTYDNVDNGLAIDDDTIGPSKLPDWGSYSAGHQYEVAWTPVGAPITAKYHDSNTSNNTGMLVLAIDALQ